VEISSDESDVEVEIPRPRMGAKTLPGLSQPQTEEELVRARIAVSGKRLPKIDHNALEVEDDAEEEDKQPQARRAWGAKRPSSGYVNTTQNDNDEQDGWPATHPTYGGKALPASYIYKRDEDSDEDDERPQPRPSTGAKTTLSTLTHVLQPPVWTDRKDESDENEVEDEDHDVNDSITIDLTNDRNLENRSHDKQNNVADEDAIAENGRFTINITDDDDYEHQFVDPRDLYIAPPPQNPLPSAGELLTQILHNIAGDVNQDPAVDPFYEFVDLQDDDEDELVLPPATRDEPHDDGLNIFSGPSTAEVEADRLAMFAGVQLPVSSPARQQESLEAKHAHDIWADQSPAEYAMSEMNRTMRLGESFEEWRARYLASNEGRSSVELPTNDANPAPPVQTGEYNPIYGFSHPRQALGVVTNGRWKSWEDHRRDYLGSTGFSADEPDPPQEPQEEVIGEEQSSEEEDDFDIEISDEDSDDDFAGDHGQERSDVREHLRKKSAPVQEEVVSEEEEFELSDGESSEDEGVNKRARAGKKNAVKRTMPMTKQGAKRSRDEVENEDSEDEMPIKRLKNRRVVEPEAEDSESEDEYAIAAPKNHQIPSKRVSAEKTSLRKGRPVIQDSNEDEDDSAPPKQIPSESQKDSNKANPRSHRFQLQAANRKKHVISDDEDDEEAKVDSAPEKEMSSHPAKGRMRNLKDTTLHSQPSATNKLKRSIEDAEADDAAPTKKAKSSKARNHALQSALPMAHPARSSGMLDKRSLDAHSESKRTPAKMPNKQQQQPKRVPLATKQKNKASLNAARHHLPAPAMKQKHEAGKGKAKVHMRTEKLNNKPSHRDPVPEFGIMKTTTTGTVGKQNTITHGQRPSYIMLDIKASKKTSCSGSAGESSDSSGAAYQRRWDTRERERSPDMNEGRGDGGRTVDSYRPHYDERSSDSYSRRR
jgi:hypothetical protein